MLLRYNGISLQVETATCEQEAVYSPEGKDLLYTHARIVVRAIWSPVATSAADAQLAGMPAAKSMNAENLRRDLLTPRKSLRFGVPIDGTFDTAIAGGEPDPNGLNPDGVNYVVLSPMRVQNAQPDQFGTDVNDGPIPLYCNIVAILGDSSMIVDYAIDTWFVECGTIRAILSNRYTMSHDIDEDYWTTRTVEGLAIFRSDFLHPRDRTADDYRSDVLPAIPDRFKRVDTHVEISPDGLQMRYRVVDQEQPQSINSAYRVISRIEGTYSESMGGQADAVLNIARNVGAGAAAGAGVGALAGEGIGAVPGGIIGAIGPLIQGLATYPTGSIELLVKVYGTRIATRRSLVNALSRVAAGFNFGNVGNVPSWVFDSNAISFGLFDRSATLYIKAEVTLFKALALKIANAEMDARIGLGDLAVLAANADRGRTVFPENIPGRVPIGGLIGGDLNANLTTTASAPTTNPPYDKGTRGLVAARVLPGNLKSPCDKIETPNGGVLVEPANGVIPQVRNAAPGVAALNDGFPVVT